MQLFIINLLMVRYDWNTIEGAWKAQVPRLFSVNTSVLFTFLQTPFNDVTVTVLKTEGPAPLIFDLNVAGNQVIVRDPTLLASDRAEVYYVSYWKLLLLGCSL